MWKKLALASCFLAFLAAFLLPILRGESPFRLGLDLAGGAMVTYRADLDSIPDRFADLPETELLRLSKDVLAGRLAQSFDTLPDVAIRGDGRLVASLPGVHDQRQVLDTLGETYRLSFRAALESRTARPDSSVSGVDTTWRPYADRWLRLGTELLDGDMLDQRSIRVETGGGLDGLQNGAAVSFAFRPPYDDVFAELTAELRGKTLAILLNDQVEWAGVVEEEIRGSGVLRGGYSADAAAEVASLLRSGQLPVNLDVEGITGVGPSLGQAMAKRGLQALAASGVVVAMILLLAYGHRPALLAAGGLSLAALVISTLGLISAFSLTVDLVAIAGLVLSIGMGMDAFILILEAFETGRLGETRSPLGLVRRAYGWRGEGRTLFHAYATTLLVTVVLLIPDRLAPFALFLSLGLAASLFTLGVTRQLLETAARRGWMEQRSTCGGPFGWIRRGRPGAVRWRRSYLILMAAGFLSAGVWLSAERGMQWLSPGADFSPGTQLFVTLESPADIESLAEAIAGRFPELDVRHQTWEAPDPDATAGFLLTLEGGEAAPNPDVLSGLLGEFDLSVHGLHGIDARLSGQRIAASLWALVGSFALLAFYLRWIQPRIDRQRRPGDLAEADATGSGGTMIFARTVLAVGLDVAVVLVALALLDIPIGMPVVAALLTTVGYSVNDSMVLWSHLSRPGEDLPATAAALSDRVDALLSRTLLTSVSTAAPALAILAVGLEPLRGFAWAVLVGTVAGTLSSIFVVAPGSDATPKRLASQDETDFSQSIMIYQQSKSHSNHGCKPWQHEYISLDGRLRSALYTCPLE
ncbi:MAG: hypothetical protein AAGF23_19085 [Acidobacteriota bacterium]